MEIDEKVFSLVEVPDSEIEDFEKAIKSHRKIHIRKASEVVDEVFIENDFVGRLLAGHDASGVIEQSREIAWRKFLIEESKFNTIFLRDLHKKIKTPKDILENLISENVADKSGDELIDAIRDVCGEYAGRIYPYIYKLSLSNTNSRRSRAGATFEAIIYKIYNILGYSYDSQKKVGRKVFEQAGLGKKVDSVLPSLDAFNQRRNKTIIGTMKTSLRERWQEVAEEIERTKIPEIHLLTVDDNISENKAEEMGAHNIVIVVPKNLAESEALKERKNIISFEEYFFEEIPKFLEYWKK